MKKEEYEIIPQELLEGLRYDVEALKKKLLQPDAKAEELILEMESVKDSVHDLNTIFQKALEEAKEEDIGVKVQKVVETLDKVTQQNETISKVLIALADKMDRLHDRVQRVQAAPAASAPKVQHTIGVPPSPMQGPRMAPPLMMEQAPPRMSMARSSDDFPPAPPGPGKKRLGIFS